jgi:hypothetical protein
MLIQVEARRVPDAESNSHYPDDFAVTPLAGGEYLIF